MPTIALDSSRIADWLSFHVVCAETFGFPDFYGNNMNAWIDCLTYVDDPGDAMSKITVPRGKVLTINLLHAASFAQRCPEQFEALIDATAFVNYRRLEVGQEPVLALAYFRSGG